MFAALFGTAACAPTAPATDPPVASAAEKTAPSLPRTSGSPSGIDAADASAGQANSLPTAPKPLTAQFFELSTKALNYAPHACTRILVAGVTGSAVVSVGTLVEGAGNPKAPYLTEASLNPGDALSLTRVHRSLTIRGHGKVALVEVPLGCACPAAASQSSGGAAGPGEEARRAAIAAIESSRIRTEARVLRAASSQKLSWARGGMVAERTTYQGRPETCDPVGLTKVENEPANTTGELYMGWLRGTEGVKEHVHRESWEIIFAVEAKGTFTLDGERRRLESGQVVVVPPNTKHSWEPDPGTTLEAVQIYTPPGPEERFATMAAAEAKPH